MTPAEKEQERNRLYRLYWQRDKEFESAKGRRLVISILAFSAFYFWLIIQLSAPKGLGFLAALVFALILGGIHVIFNGWIFGQLHLKSQEEQSILDHIKKQIAELE